MVVPMRYYTVMFVLAKAHVSIVLIMHAQALLNVRSTHLMCSIAGLRKVSVLVMLDSTVYAA